jgi:hypothetical protein
MRIVRRALPIVLVALVVGAIVLVLTSRPDLQDAEDDVETRWEPVSEQLDARYVLLATANEGVRTSPGPVGELSTEAAAALEDWRDDRDGGSVATQVAAANEVEAAARRLRGAINESPRLAGNADVAAAFDAFAAAGPAESMAPFATAVEDYEAARNGLFRALVADVFGYDAVPALDYEP